MPFADRPSPSEGSTPDVVARTISIVSFHRLPIDLVAALPELPFDVYVQRHDRMVLYAVQGSDSRAVVTRARAGLDMRAPVEDPRVLRRMMLAWLVRDLDTHALAEGTRRPGDSHERQSAPNPRLAPRIVAFLAALLAPVFDADNRLEGETFEAGRAGVDLLAQALQRDPALVRDVLGRPVEPAAIASIEPPRRWAGRAIDAVTVAVALSIAAGVEDRVVAIARAAAFRDLAMPRIVGDGRTRHVDHAPHERPMRRHVGESLRLLEAVPSIGDAARDLIATHHERLDGTGYPAGMLGAPSIAGSIVALADSFVPILSPEAAAPAATAEQAIRRLQLASCATHDPIVIGHLITLLAEGRLLPHATSASRATAN